MSAVVPFLTGAPRELTTALENTLNTCPRPVCVGPDRTKFATWQQQQELTRLLASEYLTHDEYMWVLFMRVYFSVDVADEVNRLLTGIIEHRQSQLLLPATRTPASINHTTISTEP